MKHLIIVKSTPEVDPHAFAQEAENHFQDIREIPGIHAVKVIEGIRELGREKFLERVWDWKEKYGSMIEKKAIFDYE